MSFLFFIKPSVINVDCLTANVMAYDLAKIEPAIKFVPKWWKQIPVSIGSHPYVRGGTLKGCAGFLDLYKSGFIIPTWCDLAVDIGPIGSNDYYWNYSDGVSNAVEHSQEQRGNFCDLKKYQHLKLISPWHLISKYNLNCVFTNVMWNDIELPTYKVLNGVLNFKFNNSTNINMIFKRNENIQQIFIPYKTPIVQLIPMTEKKVKLKHHLVDEKVIQQKSLNQKLFFKFFKQNLTYKAIMKSSSKCPVRHN